VTAPDGWSIEDPIETTTNSPPSVNAGADQSITLPASASLSGSASDDGLPNVGNSLTTTWSKSSGPGTVSFGNANNLNTTASFSTDGAYTLELEADDGALSVSDFIGITVDITSIDNFYFLPNLEGRPDVSGSSFSMWIYNAGGATALENFTGTADASGQVALPSNTLSDGTYDVLISSPSYLKSMNNSKSLASGNNATLSALLAGDLNGDNVINTLDWSEMSPVWFTSDAISDINQDGIVNSIDFSFLSQNWFEVGD